MEHALAQMEKELERDKGIVDTSKALERLSNNKDFKKLFLDMYTTKHTLALVKQKADVNSQTDEAQRELDNRIMAVSFFVQYMDSIRDSGEYANQRMQNTELERDRILEGEDD